MASNQARSSPLNLFTWTSVLEPPYIILDSDWRKNIIPMNRRPLGMTDIAAKSW
jgi:hypothetical protein